MTISDHAAITSRRTVRANGIDIHYVEAGQGRPLILLHGGLVSTNEIWMGQPFAYASHMARLSQHFRVIAPDTRGCGRTEPGDRAATFDTLADDVAALTAQLGLERPVVCGFSEGGCTATVLGIRHPQVAAAIVNHAGYDYFNPASPSYSMLRLMMGGSADARESDPASFAQFFQHIDGGQDMFNRLMADQAASRGEDGWKAYLAGAFERCTTPLGFTFIDLARVSTPALILVGDRDDFCSVEEGAQAFRAFPSAELAVIPNTGHVITPGTIEVTMAFLLRHS